MRKTLALIALAALTTIAWGTNRVTPSKSLRQNQKIVKESKPIKDLNSVATQLSNPGLKSIVAYNETDLGVTKYDLLSNATVSNRFFAYPDGYMADVWTMGLTPSSYPDRGTGYNYFNGTNWQSAPTARIENLRTGWPSYAPAGATGEAVVAHTATDLNFSRRENRFSGDWSFTLMPGPAGSGAEPAWPRMVASGENFQYLHILSNSYNTYNNQDMALLYSRSSDGGLTWDFQYETFADLGPDYYYSIRADVYPMAARGNTVAFLIASAWTDLVLMKSNDNGDTWEKTVIWQHPYPFYDFTSETDTFYTVDNSAALAIDKDGMVHVAFGVSKVQGHADGTYSLWPGTDGIVYWNENRPVFTNSQMGLCPWGYEGSELIPDYNLVGWTQDVNGNGQIDFTNDLYYYRSMGLSTMPSLHVDDQDNVYLAFATTTEGYDNGVYNYKHIWMRIASNKGETWSGTFTDLMGDITHIFDEGIWPQLAQISDNNLYLVYNVDPNPGLALDGDHDPVDNHQLFVEVPKDQLGVGVAEKPINQVVVEGPYPNPTTDKSYIQLTLNQSTQVNIFISSVDGRRLISMPKGMLTQGTHVIDLPLNQLKNGVYLVSLESNNTVQTFRVIKK
ncbi:MAG: T9SS type A sorting domain-containing protein [Bacteroidales bacterium]